MEALLAGSASAAAHSVGHDTTEPPHNASPYGFVTDSQQFAAHPPTAVKASNSSQVVGTAGHASVHSSVASQSAQSSGQFSLVSPPAIGHVVAKRSSPLSQQPSPHTGPAAGASVLSSAQTKLEHLISTSAVRLAFKSNYEMIKAAS